MTQSENTIWTKAYTPAGFQVGITIAFESGKPTPAADIDAMITGAGYLLVPEGAKAGEEIENIVMVMRRTQHNKDNTTTPCIGLYHENNKLQWCYWNFYLNSDDDIAQFESQTGLKINSIPEYIGDGFPLRTSANAKRFMVNLSKPLGVATKKEEYIKDDGTTGRKVVALRLLDVSQTEKPTPANVTQMPEPTGQQERKSTGAGWLKNDAALEKVKTQLAFFELNYGKDVLTSARKTVIAGGYDTPELYLEALENQIKAIGA